MMGSIRLGHWANGEVWLHWTTWLLPVLVSAYFGYSYTLAEAGLPLAVLACVYFCLILRESAQALLARSLGLGIRQFTLYPFFGHFQFARLEERPRSEFLVALAGLGMTVVQVLLLGGCLLWMGQPFIPAFEAGATFQISFANYLFWSIVCLGGIHLIPAYPLDTGKLFRCYLAMYGSRFRATEMACLLTTLVCTILGIIDLLWVQSGVLIVMALLLFLRSQEELQLEEHFVSFQILPQTSIKPQAVLPLEDVVEEQTRTENADFSGFTWNSENRLWIAWKNGQPISAIAILGDL